MINVFFDHQKFSTQKYGGISRYFASIIDEMDKENNFKSTLGVIYSNNHYIKQDISPVFKTLARKFLHSEYGSRISLLNQAYLLILEAFEAKCPMLLSDIECFEEVAGDAAIYFEKHNKEDLVEKFIMSSKIQG